MMLRLGEFGSEQAGGRPSLVWLTVKAAVLISVVSYGAVSWLSSSLPEGIDVVRTAGRAGPVEDPVTTGSIAREAGTTRLDPCVVRRP
jgi:hypothetical protein